MKDLVELIAKKLVEHPEDVQIRVIDGEEGQCLELRVNPEDMGRVIGRNGRTAKALRTVVGSAAIKTDARVSLQIVE
ncbi:MAG TPA: KH domain-containing protein [Candidatus Hydrogenedentes bacterium]|nr:KH domain-containing protein [Candidatus Hydrogenedentota bacterium]HOS01684.1 KH domain-containing protein [Candidatus Hydrogenedentota bacterium]